MKEPASVLRLDDQFNATLNELEASDRHYFITGRAGTGKSTLLRLWKRSSRKKMVVLAPTGIAALQAGGQTIHSFFLFPPRIMEAGDFKPLGNKNLIRSLDAIIIDEISMVRADMLDNIDRALRLNRASDEPFGGVQMIFFGDLFQLPPVIAQKEERAYLNALYESPYFFSASVWQEAPLPVGIELTKIYRQEELHFLKLLEEIRYNTADYDTLEALNERYRPQEKSPDHSVTVTTRRYIARAVNQKKLAQLPGTPQVFQSEVIGNFSRSTSPAPDELILKPGAQVMFIRNDPMKRYVNGTLGEILEIRADNIKVRILGASSGPPISDREEPVRAGIPGEDIVSLEKSTWENIKYTLSKEGKITSEVTGTFTQYPLNLAWAITIHKSQGMTFNQIVIDMGRGAFDFGQTYVALSRCTHLSGIYLNRPLKFSDIQTDERIVEYYRKNF